MKLSVRAWAPLFATATATVVPTFAQQPAAQGTPAPVHTTPAPGVQVLPGVQVVPALPGTTAQPGVAVPGIPGVTLVPQVPGAPSGAGPGAGAPGPPVNPGAPGAQAPAATPQVVTPVQPQPAPRPSVAEISFIVGSDVNPDLSGRPSPVIVRTYELKSATAFNSSDFFALYDRDKEVLGPDLVARDDWALVPGNNRQALKNLQRDTRYVGVLAAFRDVDRARWRAATFVYPSQTTRMQIRLNRNEVTVSLH